MEMATSSVFDYRNKSVCVCIDNTWEERLSKLSPGTREQGHCYNVGCKTTGGGTRKKNSALSVRCSTVD
jgi:hypothetical protein